MIYPKSPRSSMSRRRDGPRQMELPPGRKNLQFSPATAQAKTLSLSEGKTYAVWIVTTRQRAERAALF